MKSYAQIATLSVHIFTKIGGIVGETGWIVFYVWLVAAAPLIVVTVLGLIFHHFS